MSTSYTNRNHPYYKMIKESDEEGVDFFLKHRERMKSISLGELFDFISWGGINYVAYELDTKGLINLTQKWMEIREIEKNGRHFWNKSDQEETVELPRINYDECPREKIGVKHNGTTKNRLGRIVCSHVDKIKVKPNFVSISTTIDPESFLEKKVYWNNEPYDPTPEEWMDEDGNELDYTEEFKEYEKELKKYQEEKEETILDPCYAIIKESSDFYIKLETLFDRLNCSNYKELTTHPFPGFTLANYVKTWWEQPGRKRIWRKKGEHDFYKAFPDFKHISSDD